MAPPSLLGTANLMLHDVPPSAPLLMLFPVCAHLLIPHLAKSVFEMCLILHLLQEVFLNVLSTPI
jgi:hypothetical protein